MPVAAEDLCQRRETMTDFLAAVRFYRMSVNSLIHVPSFEDHRP